MKKINILFLTPRYFPSLGGVQKHLQQITELLKDKYQITIITEQYEAELKTKEKVNGTTVYRIPTTQTSEKSKKWKIWNWIWSNRSLIASADIIHVHDVAYWMFPFRLLYPNKKFFITYHGYEGSRPPGWKAVFQRKIGEWMSSGTICIGDFMSQWYNARPTIVSYGAANLKPQNFPKKTNAIFLGRLEEDTGITEYLKAFILLPKPLKLDIFGDGSLKHRTEKFIKENNLPITFRGFLPNADRYLSKYRFAFTSRYLGILEAMQAKRLVFAHYNNAIKEDYLRCHPQAKNVIIFHTAKELAKKISEVIENPSQEKKQIEYAYSWAKEQTWEKLAGEYEKLWQTKD